MFHLKSLLSLVAASCLVGLVLISLAGCGGGDDAAQQQSKYTPADDTPTTAINAQHEGAANTQPNTQPSNTLRSAAGQPAPSGVGAPSSPAAGQLTDYTVPDGNAEQLLAFMQQLLQQTPRGATEEELQADFANIHRARLEAADKVLNSAADAESQLAAANHKVHALRMLEQVGEPGIGEKLDAMADSLVGSSDPQLAEFGKMIVYSSDFDNFMSSENPDPALLLDKLKGLLTSSDKSYQMFQVARSTIDAFRQLEMRDATVEAIRLTGQSFQNAADEQLAKEAESMLKQVQVLDLGLDTTVKRLYEGDETAPAALVEIVRKMMQINTDDEILLQVGQRIAKSLEEQRKPAEAAQIYRMLGEKYQGSQDERQAIVAQELLTQSRMAERDFDGIMLKVIEGRPGAPQEAVAVIQDLLRNEKPGESLLYAITQAAEHLELANEFAAEQQVVDMIEAVYANHGEEDFAETSKRWVAGARKRIALVGRPFNLNATTLDGKPFDFSQYKGKVVLVDFWATWCQPCMDEIPNIRRLYEAYHDQGFEVVGVNLDSPAALESWLAVNSDALPWPVVVDGQPEKNDFESPLAENNGVKSLPFLLLINRDGLVEAMHTRGSDLQERLEAKFGPLPETANPAGLNVPAGNAPAGTGIVPSSGDGAALHDGRSRPSSDNELNTGREYFTAFVADDTEDAEEDADEDELAKRNPYLAPPGSSDTDLALYLLDMADKPRVIQERPGFAEAVVEAAERLLKMNTKPNYKRVAILAKLRTLHRLASLGDEKADEQLAAYVGGLKNKQDEKVAAEVKFLRLERAAINCDDLPKEKVPELLAELKKFFEEEKRLEEKHLRIASNTVRAVNRLEDDDEREKYFAEFGKLFAASPNRQLSIYGKTLSKSPGEAESDLVGKELELTGLTSLGVPFEWKKYRGKVVVVDFWATWCGPCIREMPHVRELHKKLKDKGFDVVGVNLDKDPDALAKFLEENDVPWENLTGEATQDLARKYGIRGIPTMMLVDREGKVVAVSHQVASLADKAQELVKKAAE
jgi:thiol-disulfide isomerase/thioredoxin